MPMTIEDGIARLSGTCPIEEAEALAQFLAATPDARLDLAGCTGLHSALLQVVLAAAPAILAAPADPFLAALLPAPISAEEPA